MEREHVLHPDIEQALSEAWLKSSLGSDSAKTYLDHPSSEDQSGIFYCPPFVVGKDTIWHIRSITLTMDQTTFSFPPSIITGVFIDTRKSRLILAVKELEMLTDENGQAPELPYDHYYYNGDENNFRILYQETKKGTSVVLDKSAISKHTGQESTADR